MPATAINFDHLIFNNVKRLFATCLRLTSSAGGEIRQSVCLLHESLRRFARLTVTLTPPQQCIDLLLDLLSGLSEIVSELEHHIHTSSEANHVQASGLAEGYADGWAHVYCSWLRFYTACIETVTDAILRIELRRQEPNAHGSEALLAHISSFAYGYFPPHSTSHNPLSTAEERFSTSADLLASKAKARRINNILNTHLEDFYKDNVFSGPGIIYGLRSAIYWYSMSYARLESAAQSSSPVSPSSSLSSSTSCCSLTLAYYDAIKAASLLLDIFPRVEQDSTPSLAQNVTMALCDCVAQTFQIISDTLRFPDYDTLEEFASHELHIPKNLSTISETIQPSIPVKGQDIPTPQIPAMAKDNSFAPCPSRPNTQVEYNEPIIVKEEVNSERKPSFPLPEVVVETNSVEQPNIPEFLSPVSPLRPLSGYTNRENLPQVISFEDGLSRTRSVSPASALSRELQSSVSLGHSRRTPSPSVDTSRQSQAATSTSTHEVSSSASSQDGLLIANMEQDITVSHIDDIVSSHGQYELLLNHSEGSEGVQSLLAARPGGPYQLAKVRAFMHAESETVDVYTSQAGPSIHRFNVHVDLDELVPVYAWEDSLDPGCELYFRHLGSQHGLRYKIIQQPQDTSIYEFIGAFIGAQFEASYRIRSIRFDGSKLEKVAENTIMEVWTDAMGSSHTAENQLSSRSRTHRLNAASVSISDNSISANIEARLGRLPCSKLFIYSSNEIFCIILSHRVCLESIIRTSLEKRAHTIRLVPNTSQGCSSIRVRRLGTSRGHKAGLPLSGKGIRYADQDSATFEDVNAITLGFHTEKSFNDFLELFDDLQADWEERCAPLRRPYKLQRERKVTTSSKLNIRKKIRDK